MKKTVVLTALVLAIGAGIAFAHNNRRSIREFLTGVQEVPVVSTTGSGTFHAEISKDGDEIEYTLSFKDLEGDIRQAHIHIAPEQNSGPIVLWLCQTAANVAPAGTNPPQCFNALAGESPRSNTVSGVLRASDVIPQLTNGIAANELAEVLALIRAGKSYVNMHSSMSPAGEIRSQIAAITTTTGASPLVPSRSGRVTRPGRECASYLLPPTSFFTPTISPDPQASFTVASSGRRSRSSISTGTRDA